jgi:hypothetical protein
MKEKEKTMTTIPDSPFTHEDSAQTIRIDLQRLAQGIRGFALLTTDRRRQLNITGHVDEEYLRRVALLLDSNTDVANSSKLTSAEIRDHLAFYGAYDGVGEELMLNGRKMSDTLLAERGGIGERAIRAVKIARDMTSPSDREALIPHLESIDREFSRGRRRKRPVTQTDEPETPIPPEVKP